VRYDSAAREAMHIGVGRYGYWSSHGQLIGTVVEVHPRVG